MVDPLPAATVRARPQPPEAAAGRLAVHPRAFVALSTTVAGTRQVDTGIVPTKASVVLRPHNQAGTAEVTIHGSALPFDERQIAGIYLQVFLGDVPAVDAAVNRLEYLRFVGYVDELKPTLDEHGTSVELKARDLSALLREFKPLPAAAVPRYSDTLGEAAQRILDATPGARNPDGTARLTLRDVPETRLPLGAAVGRRAATAHVQMPPDVTAWQALEHCAGLLSLLVSVDLNEVVVRRPAQSFGHTDPPAAEFVFGGAAANLLSVERTKKFVRNRRGVKVTAFDPITRQRMEAEFPPDGDLATDTRPPAHVGGTRLRAAPHAATSGRRRAAPAARREPDRDVFPAPWGMHTPDSLRAYAERLYLERSRQEIEGKLVTPLWTNAVLGLRNASRFSLRVRPELEAELRATRDDDAAVELLVRRLGVDRGAAAALVRAARSRPLDLWYARTITHEFAAAGRSGTTIEFLNLIDVSDGP